MRTKATGAALPGADFLLLAEIAGLQAERWARQANRVAATSPFYRDLWGGRLPDGRLVSLADLPLSDKAMLRADQAGHPPFGSYLAAPPEAISRVHRTSGTSGQAMNLALSRDDAVMTAQVAARAQAAAGLGLGHRVIHCLNYQLWMGGYSDHAGLEATGATVIPFGVGNSETLIRTITELGVTAISCTPSYPTVLEQVLAARGDGFEPSDLGLRLGLFGGEAGLDDPAFRARLESVWGFKARNSNYGVSDVLCNFAGQCALENDLHFVALDVLYPELIDPVSAAPKAWREGETGELVLTHLVKDCQPLVRFRTGDIITLTGLGPAACGRTAPRFRVIGRSDEMVVVRGINVFPTMVAAVINGIEALSGDYRIPLPGPPPYDHLPLLVERAAAAAAISNQDLAGEVATRVKADLGVTARVSLLPAGGLPAVEGKTKRVLQLDRGESP